MVATRLDGVCLAASVLTFAAAFFLDFLVAGLGLLSVWSEASHAWTSSWWLSL